MSDRQYGPPGREPLAIVGIGCHFPGGAVTPDAYWDLLCSGVDATRELPQDRWEIGKFYDPDPAKLGKMSTFRGGFLDRVDQFDAQFFGISPREAIWLDPQQRLLLRATWEALEDAGQDADRLAGSDTGVFVGGFTLDYKLLQNYGVHSRYELQAHSATGMMMTMLANRLSHAFDFRGPSLAVDTACSGSLVALHLATQAIWNGECSQAVVGGANVMLAPNMTIAESKGGFLSPDGRCKTFDASANGYARGEGAGVVLLKPLAQAQADRDSIYALVRGTAVRQDGRTNGITVPNGASQEAAMRAAYASAGVSPHEVQYVEAHGTGTPVGDPIEAAAIGRVLSTNRPDNEPIFVGSVKTNIGHLEAAAGVAGLIKAALCLKHGRIPGHLHLKDPNPAIPFAAYGLRVPTQLIDWPTSNRPRYAGVNSFGFGGTNAHAVLQEPPAEAAVSTRGDDRRHVVTLSARSADALHDLAESMCTFLDETDHAFSDVAYSCNLRRTHHDHRLAVIAQNSDEARARLRAHLDEEKAAGVVGGRAQPGGKPKLAFVFSGMGPQWWGMGRQLFATEPVFRAAVEACAAELRKHTGWSLVEELLADEDRSRMAETEVAQPANFALQVGLAELWRSWGIEPDAIIGHSAGEVAAQYVSGVLTLAEAAKVIHYRSSLQQRTSGSGRMLAVGMTPETLNQAVADAGPQVSVAAINSPSAVTLSGDAQILESMAAQLKTFGVFHRFLPVKVPYHSHLMDPLRADLETGLANLSPSAAKLPLYSTVTGSRIDGRGADAHYWWQNVRATVLFSAAFSEMVDDGCTHFVELAPHPVLASSMRELLTHHEREGLVVPSLRRDEPDDEVLLRTLGSLHSHGHPVKWETFHSADARFVKLPNYPWQLKTYWNESAEAREDRHYEQVHPLLGQRMNAPHPTWEVELNTGHLAYLVDHRIQDNTLMPGAALIEMALAAAHQVYGSDHYSVDGLQLRKALVLSPVSDARLRTTLYQEQARVEIASYLALPSGERQWTVHATAQLGTSAAAPAPRDVAGTRAGCGNHISQDEFYTQTRGMGFEYGPAFQGVRNIATGDRVAVGAVAIPDEIRAGVGDYLFHPCLVDAAFQVLLIAATPPDTDHERVTPYLPVRIDRIRVLAPPTAEMVVVAHVVAADRAQIVSDIALCNSTGRVLVEIEGFRAQSLAAAASLSPERIDRGLYELEWQETPRKPTFTDDDAAAEVPALGATGTDAAWVIFTDATGVGAEAATILRAEGRRVFCVTHTDVGEFVDGSNDAYTIDPANQAHYLELIRRLRDHEIGKVVHLWSLDIDLDETSSADDLQGSQEIGVLSVMRLMQALSAELSQVPKVWLATSGAQSLGADNHRPNIAQAPLWGLGRVIGHQEFATLWGGLCDLDPQHSDSEQARLLVDEITGADVEDQIAMRGSGRYVARLAESTELTPPFPARMRDAGSYLVTGGLGSLGLLVAQFLAERGARDVVLMGRTPVPPRQSWDELPDDHPQLGLVGKLRELESFGARIHLAAVDVTDPDQMRQWLNAHHEQGLPPIAGVVHTAGVVDDELLVRMDQATFTKVLRPKLVGGWLLHRLFRDTALDFFVLFSSTGSVIASPGQGNYAAGNAFLDALAVYRQRLGLPALSIGWGPWSVGMVEQLDLEQMYARRGIELITPEAGMQILGRVLHQRPAHLVAITVDWVTARETSLAGQLPPMFTQLEVRDQGDQPEGGGADVQSVLAALRQAAEGERAAVLVGHLRDVAARVLGLEAEKTSTEETLSNLGLDSMMAIEMKHRIEAVLQIDVSVLDLLQGATISGLAEGLVARLELGGADTAADADESVPAGTGNVDDQLDELERLLADTAPDELEALLGELDAGPLADHEHDQDSASVVSSPDAKHGEGA
ncbi:type I polyketide synthase [Streptomyces sp. NBC_00847]|uniref:type I polyketide synthase n=1 Tax=Streptomyces sp. NBC_00847 TaxID=2975850 RepID=UPI0022506379|nr:type I polyketide synthase [Streptomyces sp. NBC_00847]MCX4884635.1 type I polyketide synthase [Streptomyces sp. NBC_00847]